MFGLGGVENGEVAGITVCGAGKVVIAGKDGGIGPGYAWSGAGVDGQPPAQPDVASLVPLLTCRPRGAALRTHSFVSLWKVKPTKPLSCISAQHAATVAVLKLLMLPAPCIPTPCSSSEQFALGEEDPREAEQNANHGANILSTVQMDAMDGALPLLVVKKWRVLPR